MTIAGPTWRMGAVALTILPFAAAAQPVAGAAGLSFQGARLGMSRDAWQSLAPPGTSLSRAKVLCTQPPAGAASVTCTYVLQYGRFALPATVKLSDGRRATGLRYAFVGDRLSQIEYQVSVDEYEALVGRFNALYGPATQVRRDQVRTPDGSLPRVTQIWKSPAGTVELVDPVAPFSKLRIRLSSSNALPEQADVTGPTLGS